LPEASVSSLVLAFIVFAVSFIIAKKTGVKNNWVFAPGFQANIRQTIFFGFASFSYASQRLHEYKLQGWMVLAGLDRSEMKVAN
jgi:hypothetical protein